MISAVCIPLGNNQPNYSSRPLLFLVEGQHDAEFLRRITARLSLEISEVQNLAVHEQAGRLVFIPIGGGNVLGWSTRFAPLACAEIHLYDREIAPETALRRRAIEEVNARPCCRAFLTSKRSLENYLHPKAILQAGGPTLDFCDNDPVAEFVAREKFSGTTLEWNNLSNRSRSRFANRVKWWLNTVAVDHMSFDLLDERDPRGEVRGWLQLISSRLKGNASD